MDNIDTKSLLQVAFQYFFGHEHVEHCFADMVEVNYNQSRSKEKIYSGMLLNDPKGPLLINIVRMISTFDGKRLDGLARIFSGTINVGDEVTVIAEGEKLGRPCTITRIWFCCGRYRVPLEKAVAGSVVLLEGLEEAVTKTATVISAVSEVGEVFRPLVFHSLPMVKVAIEPYNPADLPRLLEGIGKAIKTHPILETRVEGSGEHVIFGTGELFLDCVLHDLRRVFAAPEIASTDKGAMLLDLRVSDPATRFSETVSEMSFDKSTIDTPNHRNKIMMIAEPLELDLVHDLEANAVRSDLGEYGWDILAARNLWAFGPDPSSGPNVLINDTLPLEVDKKRLSHIKENMSQGFIWTVQEGPLCEEPVRGVKFRLIGAELDKDPVYSEAGQIIPATRKAIYDSMLKASPKLMEPIYRVEIQAPSECIPIIHKIFGQRRGHVTKEHPKAGSPLCILTGLMPIMDSFGFEADLRTSTKGMAFCQQIFDHWEIVPGDPLDTHIQFSPLEPAPVPHLARDFLLKTRRRKGLPENI
jgi:U5 small nuclear ribonucleoprotein component